MVTSLGERICCKRADWHLTPRLDACWYAEMQSPPLRWSMVGFLGDLKICPPGIGNIETSA